MFATGRAKRHTDTKKNKPIAQPKERCPFEDPETSGNEILATYFNQNKTDWIAKIAKNKFPAVVEVTEAIFKQIGPFSVTAAKGFHEVVIFREHDRCLHDFSKEELAEIMKIYQERYLYMASQGSSKYILIFHNKGDAAGASIQHPHSQIMSIPILPPDVKRSIRGSEEFYKKNGKRIYDEMINWEIREKKRIVCENESFIAFCPFVSKVPYEIRIFPKESHAHFEKIPEGLLIEAGDIMKTVLSKMFVALDDPDFNFFIHTSPLEGTTVEPHQFYTWHIEILPRIPIVGGFELGSGIDVNLIDPDEAAKLLHDA